MVNSDDFSKRLQKILEYHDLSAAAFSDAIDVGRSSISHILSGRNKPSLDFVLKVVQTYPEVELYWLLNGKGSFPNTTGSTPYPEKQMKQASSDSPAQPVSRDLPAKALVSENLEKSSAERKIRKIVIFYQDGTFEAFEN
ncbi:helix-turn-helix domain-containing protein [Gillisia limnaea]|uniref:Helix-turn-helix domain protein n=1 Tax=Gillisia limnaea (strain DSM 15749 / LMG 21470 / R-8282) TaxID=865937 RepID=H2C0C9_GILLR|nr:helix-turn-helix transcriptional regulator [Gillisia limnaea]EHQ01109.1 helix-turn-helix domain protein [Gillisia limnaea DSM 15749]